MEILPGEVEPSERMNVTSLQKKFEWLTKVLLDRPGERSLINLGFRQPKMTYRCPATQLPISINHEFFAKFHEALLRQSHTKYLPES